ncbi:MAG: hypothetical protein S4CHLAM45_00070 [Chlamydiales bacterium]|nr:hypothetical protein [Chlamydiales bacterium]MCH9619332.1 hypothetical protein [Chlamydiales bacterium]MCH9622136.1 hypothetical protein [Chlamydiales bacterium]
MDSIGPDIIHSFKPVGDSSSKESSTISKTDNVFQTIIKLLRHLPDWISMAWSKYIDNPGKSFAKEHGMEQISTMFNQARPGSVQDGTQYELKEKESGERATSVRSTIERDLKSARGGASDLTSNDRTITVSEKGGKCYAASMIGIRLFHDHGQDIEKVKNAFSWGVPFVATLIQAIHDKGAELSSARPGKKQSAKVADIRARHLLKLKGERVNANPDSINKLQKGAYAIAIPPPKKGGIGHEISFFIVKSGRYIMDINQGMFKLNNEVTLSEALQAVAEEYHSDGLNAKGVLIDKITSQNG